MWKSLKREKKKNDKINAEEDWLQLSETIHKHQQNRNNQKTKTLLTFQATNKILHEKTWAWLRKWNLKKETKSLLIAEQINAIRTNYTKARINKTKQDSKYWSCGDRDDTTEAHWLGIWGFFTSTIFPFSLVHRLPFFQVSRHYLQTASSRIWTRIYFQRR